MFFVKIRKERISFKRVDRIMRLDIKNVHKNCRKIFAWIRVTNADPQGLEVGNKIDKSHVRDQILGNFQMLQFAQGYAVREAVYIRSQNTSPDFKGPKSWRLLLEQ